VVGVKKRSTRHNHIFDDLRRRRRGVVVVGNECGTNVQRRRWWPYHMKVTGSGNGIQTQTTTELFSAYHHHLLILKATSLLCMNHQGDNKDISGREWGVWE